MLDHPNEANLRLLAQALRRCGLDPADLIWKTAPSDGTVSFRLSVDPGAGHRLSDIVEHMQRVGGVRDVRYQITAAMSPSPSSP